MMHKAWSSIEDAPYGFSMSSVKFDHTAAKSSILTRIGRFRTVTPVWTHRWLWNGAQSFKLGIGEVSQMFLKVIYQISRSHGTENRQVWPELSVSRMYLQFEFTDGFETMHNA